MFGNGGENLSLQHQQRPLRQVGFPEVVGDRLPELGVAVVAVAIVAAAIVAVVLARPLPDCRLPLTSLLLSTLFLLDVRWRNQLLMAAVGLSLNFFLIYSL